MQAPIAHQLAQFVSETSYTDIPEDVLDESKRILLDSLGCAIAAVGETKGQIAIEYAQALGGGAGEATIFGTKERSSIFGAAFANGELINALDFDAVLPPGHVSPYVLPGALAIAETEGASGKDLLLAVAISHELSNRFGKAMDYIRDTVDGVLALPPVLGYTSTIFGATAAIARLRGASAGVTSQALAIAASIAPVNSHRSWLEHIPVSTIKYTMAGPVVQSALTAAFMASYGHRGDPAVFDDPEFGYPKFIGTKRWEPQNLTRDLGTEWNFHRENSFKHYPHCRALHGLLDLLIDTLDEHQLQASEIDAIRAWGEGHVDRSSWLTKMISHPVDGQFSIAHGLAVGAQRIPASKAWQAPETVFDPDVLSLMDRVSYEVHPDWATAIATDPAARPSRLEIDARGRTFTAELRYPRGTPGAAGGVGTSNEQLISKFYQNVEGVLSDQSAKSAVGSIMTLESEDNVASLLRSLGGS